MESQFEKLLVDLVRGRVDFIVVGGIAVALNGIVRTTDDLDIIVDAAPPNIERLLQTLSRVGDLTIVDPIVTEDEPPRHKEHQEDIRRRRLRQRISKSISDEVSGLSI